MLVESDAVYSYVGARIRARRRALGLTQEQLAQQLDLKRTSVTNIEAGRQKLPLDLLYQFCAILGMEIDTLLPPMELVLRAFGEEDVLSKVAERVPPKTALLVRTLLEQLEEE